MRVNLCARPRCASLGIRNSQISLLSSVEQAYLFDIFRRGEGQILLTEKIIKGNFLSLLC